MFYKKVKIKISERKLLKLVLGSDFPDTRQITHETKLLDLVLEKLRKEGTTETDTFSKEIVLQFYKTPIYGLRVGEVLRLNNYRIIVDSNDNILMYIDNLLEKSASRTIHEVIFIYESDDFFKGSKVMQRLIGKIDEINKDAEEFYESVSQESKYLLKTILKDEYKLDNLIKRNQS